MFLDLSVLVCCCIDLFTFVLVWLGVFLSPPFFFFFFFYLIREIEKVPTTVYTYNVSYLYSNKEIREKLLYSLFTYVPVLITSRVIP